MVRAGPCQGSDGSGLLSSSFGSHEEGAADGYELAIIEMRRTQRLNDSLQNIKDQELQKYIDQLLTILMEN